jgi:hypothetical protein
MWIKNFVFHNPDYAIAVFIQAIPKSLNPGSDNCKARQLQTANPKLQTRKPKTAN